VTSPAEEDRAPALRVRSLSKAYSGVLALDALDLDIRAGEVHALLGGNGSGKSTAIKILAGVVDAEPGGQIEAGGTAARSDQWSPSAAHAAGLRFVHQQPAVFPELTIAENLALGAGFPTGPGQRIRWSVLHRRTAELLEQYHIAATPKTPLGALRAVDRSRVAIIRALQDRDETGNGVLVLDEPTAALPGPEVEQLLDALRAYAGAGQTILYVSHRLDEALSVADRVTVLRDGRKVATVSTAGLSEGQLIELIVGRPIERLFPEVSQDAHDDGALSLRGVHGGPLHGVDLSVRKGEVLGIAGLLGSGRSELLRMIFGAYPMLAGRLTIDGQPYRPASPSAAMAAGVAYVPEERQADALFHAESVRHNLSAGQDSDYFRRLLFRHGQERRDATRSISEFLVRAVSDRQPVQTLSGGNQQKVVLARWLRQRPRLLLLDEPTQGVDVSARSEIYQLVRRATAAGTSVILVASDMEELAHACDRVAVLKGGRIVAVIDQPLDAHQLTDLVNTSEAAA
jgi:ribose transport system ATP-binding protein